MPHDPPGMAFCLTCRTLTRYIHAYETKPVGIAHLNNNGPFSFYPIISNTNSFQKCSICGRQVFPEELEAERREKDDYIWVLDKLLTCIFALWIIVFLLCLVLNSSQ